MSDLVATRTALQCFQDVIAAFEKSWPMGTEYPFPMRADGLASGGVASAKGVAWLTVRLFPLNGIDNLRGMQPFLDYLSQFNQEHLGVFLDLAELNLSELELSLWTGPAAKLFGTIAALGTALVSLSNAKVIALPSRLWEMLAPMAWALVLLVALYVLVLLLTADTWGRTRVLRNLIRVALQERTWADAAAATPSGSAPRPAEVNA